MSFSLLLLIISLLFVFFPPLHLLLITSAFNLVNVLDRISRKIYDIFFILYEIITEIFGNLFILFIIMLYLIGDFYIRI